MKYMVVIEQGPNSWGAHVPDLSGCIAAAESKEQALRLIQQAVEFHLEGLRADGEPIPAPRSNADYVEVTAA